VIIALLIFFATFAIAAASNMQSRNAVLGHYFSLFFTSVFIGTINLFLLKTIPTISSGWQGVSYILGGALGAVCGVILHKRLYTKRKLV
jgi:hypothetical protein